MKETKSKTEKPATDKPRALHYGDCLDIVRTMDEESVDLIYLDPPFNSKADYNMLFGSESEDDQAQIQAFSDTWYWNPGHQDVYNRFMARSGTLGKTAEALMDILGPSGMLAYLLFMMERLIELKRVLKKTGSLYLHCDPTASHYLKIVMDSVFGANMFRNEIIWRIGWVSGYKTQKKGWIRNHDTILYYLKSDAARDLFNKEYIPYPDDYVRRDGKRPNGQGIPIEDTWNCNSADVLDSIMIKSFSREKLGYPTQKPLALLERIIKASSNEGGVILDPFCGCGTSVDAAEALGRGWIGIDISTLAVNVVLDRIERLHGKKVHDAIDVIGIPRDVPGAQKLSKDRNREFERWAVGLLRGRPNDKQTGDGGSDGTLIFPSHKKNKTQRGVISVKGVKEPNPAMVRELHGTVEKDRAQIGILITLTEPTRGMMTTANQYGIWEDEFTGAKFPRIQIITIADLLAGKKPDMPTPLSPYVDPKYSHTQQEEML